MKEKEIVWVLVGYKKDGFKSTTKIFSHCRLKNKFESFDIKGVQFKGREVWNRLHNKSLVQTKETQEYPIVTQSILLNDEIFICPARNLKEFKMYNLELFI